jgi:hypothetical protein
MEKHRECEHACQQAVGYGVWPEHQCRPECVWLKAEQERAQSAPQPADARADQPLSES